MSELKHCAHCGESAKIMEVFNPWPEPRSLHVGCSKCPSIMINVVAHFDNVEEIRDKLIEAWNRRVKDE